MSVYRTIGPLVLNVKNKHADQPVYLHRHAFVVTALKLFAVLSVFLAALLLG